MQTRLAPQPTSKGLRLMAGYGLLLSVALSAGATSFADIVNAEKKTIAAGAATQQRIAQLDDERAELVMQYRSALRRAEDLGKYNDQLRTVQEAQHEEIASLRQQVESVGSLEEDIVPLMADMLDALEEFVLLDAPFLESERRGRIERLRNLLASSENPSEKYRRILEAYQIENDYGRSVEAYDAPLLRDGEERVVSFLKVGRAVFVYQSMDGRESFLWNRSSRRWEPLDERFNAAISRGIRMAREQIPSDLLLLPVSKTQL